MTKGNVARSSSSIGIRKTFADALDREHALELGDFVYRVDMVNPFDAVQIALVNRVNTQKARLTLRVGLAPFTDRDAFRACLVEMAALTLVAVGVA